MQGLDFSDSLDWSIGRAFGYDYPFLSLSATTILHTWIIIALTCGAIFIIRLLFNRKPILRYLVTFIVEAFMSLTVQSLGYFSFNHFCFIGSLFLFILLCNIAPIIPWLKEPTNNLNTTLALGLISFIYIQRAAIKTSGLRAYIKNEYFSPFFLMAPLHIVGKIASIISISFRLFGNIFGGFIISHIYFGTLESVAYSWVFQLIGLLTGLNFIIVGFFTLFEGFLQAFVFTMLSLTYLSIALHEEES